VEIHQIVPPGISNEDWTFLIDYWLSVETQVYVNLYNIHIMDVILEKNISCIK